MDRKTLFAAVLFGPTVPLSLITYPITKKGSQHVKNVWISLLWLWYLCLPFWGASQNAIPQYSAATLLITCWPVVFCLNVTQLVLFPRTNTNNDKDDPEEKKKKKFSHRSKFSRQRMSVQDALKFCGACLYFAFPVNAVEDEEKRKPTFVMKQVAIQSICAVSKLFQMLFFTQVLAKIEQQHSLRASTHGPLIYMEMLVLFSFVLIGASHLADMQGICVRVLSLGRYEMLPSHRYPFISSSMREMWGHRYNLPITDLLRRTVYEPCQTYFRWSRGSSFLATFVISGLFHAYSAYFTFGRGMIRTFLFFVIQAPWIAFVEPQTKGWNKGVRQVLTLVFFYVSFAFYGGLFVEVMPHWIYGNYHEQEPPFPFIIKLVDKVASSKIFGLPTSAEVRLMSEAWLESQ